MFKFDVPSMSIVISSIKSYVSCFQKFYALTHIVEQYRGLSRGISGRQNRDVIIISKTFPSLDVTEISYFIRYKRVVESLFYLVQKGFAGDLIHFCPKYKMLLVK